MEFKTNNCIKNKIINNRLKNLMMVIVNCNDLTEVQSHLDMMNIIPD